MLGFLLKKYFKCKHKKVSPLSTGPFCPDCGKEIEISWILLRCSCCQSKREASVVFNSLVPRHKYCAKCGTLEYFSEKKEHIEFFDFPYALICKKEINPDMNSKEIIQIWIDKEQNYKENLHNYRLLPILN